MQKKLLNLLFFVALAGFALPAWSYAVTDLSLSDGDVTFSKNNPLENEQVRIFARIFNKGDTDVLGNVIFLSNGKKIAESLPISVRVGTYDDVFLDYKFKAGTYDIEARIINENYTDDNSENNNVTKKEFFVDLDTDKDEIGDSKDLDDDNDGVSDEQESVLKTDSKNLDTDGDSVNDKIDSFPLNKTEYRDTDADGIGDNNDPDADNDGVLNEEEKIKYGTNPLSVDTDADGLTDGQEIKVGTNPQKTDTDADGSPDSIDKYPLDASKWQAGLLGSAVDLFNENKFLSFVLGVPALLIFLLLLFHRKRK